MLDFYMPLGPLLAIGAIVFVVFAVPIWIKTRKR